MVPGGASTGEREACELRDADKQWLGSKSLRTPDSFTMLTTYLKDRIRINRNEFSGAFGDIGTDLPLIIGMLFATNLEMSNTLIVFGVLQILTAVIYGIPMPVQPLKAVALIVITQKLSAAV